MQTIEKYLEWLLDNKLINFLQYQEAIGKAMERHINEQYKPKINVRDEFDT